MSIEAIRSSTLDGIKRLAKDIKALQHIQHSLALDVAAKHAGFQSFKHARNQLTRIPTSGPSHRVFVTAYWRDEESVSAVFFARVHCVTPHATTSAPCGD